MEEEQEFRSGRRKKRKFRFGRLFFLLMLPLIAIGIFAFIQFYNGYAQAEDTEQESVNFSGDSSNSDFENTLILGVDARGEEQSRTDTMMLVSHNKETNEIKVTSFMRDIYAQIPGYQPYKLNTAYYLGGADLLADTLRDMFGLEIHHYALLDFKSFEALVDIVAPNGVEINVEKEMSKDIGVTLTPGLQQLNGQELLGYARFRADSEGDFGRVRRQQEVIGALKEELISISAIPKYPRLAGAAQGHIQTDISMLKQIELAARLAVGGGGEVERLTIPVDNSYRFNSYPHAGSVIELDLEANKRALSEFLSQPLE
ncbi:MAG TPA: LCP family protein [Planococcus sp. (in: firmicutes)]|nr:LCP family protein [Planococcus sp. (in: firmicutes)]